MGCWSSSKRMVLGRSQPRLAPPAELEAAPPPYVVFLSVPWVGRKLPREIGPIVGCCTFSLWEVLGWGRNPPHRRPKLPELRRCRSNGKERPNRLSPVEREGLKCLLLLLLLFIVIIIIITIWNQNKIGWNQTRLDQIKSEIFRSDQTKSDQIRSYQNLVNSNQI